MPFLVDNPTDQTTAATHHPTPFYWHRVWHLPLPIRFAVQLIITVTGIPLTMLVAEVVSRCGSNRIYDASDAHLEELFARTTDVWLRPPPCEP